jgi:glycosyltransferase involved in cell wall biosynthesis
MQGVTISIPANHISVCVCTYKRPDLLRRLLKGLTEQDTCGSFTYSVVVVDNDIGRSAEFVVREFGCIGSAPVNYVVEARQNIALARNKAVAHTAGDFLAFIDDDEFPESRWLHTLFTSCKSEVDGVLGPVKPHFDVTPPRWVIEGKFYERATYPTGLVIDWRKGRTGNVLLRRKLFTNLEQPFKPEFRNGEDQEFFHRMIEKGHVFIWCNEAVAYEVVPPIRWRRTFMLRRALLRGSIEPKTPNFGIGDIAKSLIAIPVYTAALLFAWMLGQSKFMNLMVRLCDHLGKLLALIGIDPIKDQYVTE